MFKIVHPLWKTIWKSLKMLNIVNIWSRNTTPKYIPKITESIHPHKNSHMNIHSNVIHNSQNVGTTKTSINWWMYKQNVVYPYNNISLGNRNEWNSDTCYNMDESRKHNTKWKKTDTKAHYYEMPKEVSVYIERVDWWQLRTSRLREEWVS